jgi:hypothetical protein
MREALNFPFEYVTEKRYSIQGQFDLWQGCGSSRLCRRVSPLRPMCAPSSNTFLSLFASQERGGDDFC